MQARHFTLEPDTVATVDDFTKDASAIEVLSRDGAGEVFFTVGDTDAPPAAPGVEADDTYVVPATVSALTTAAPGVRCPILKLVSSSAVAVSVTAYRGDELTRG